MKKPDGGKVGAPASAEYPELTRRGFLKAGGAMLSGGVFLAGASAEPLTIPDDSGTTAAPKATAPPVHSDSDKKIRIGIVGGRFGAQFHWHLHPNCIVEAVSDLNPERCDRLSKVYNCSKQYSSLEELIKDPAVDAVGVFTGAPDHVRHSVACLHAGKHVISAVPAGMTVEECEELLDVVTKTGLHYMMAETSYYHQSVITARQWYDEGKFGRILHSEAEYFHPGLEVLYFDDEGKRTWRYGLAPMNYPTHCTGQLIGVTGEHLTRVTCTGWGDDSPFLKDNDYNNPFWGETAMFQTDKGASMRVAIWWKGPVGGTERAEWYGEKMSFFNASPEGGGHGPIVRRLKDEEEKDDAGFGRKASLFEKFDQPQHWKSEMLPTPLRVSSGHDSSHPFLTHEFVDALVNDRRPAIDIFAALNMTIPGIVAHQSALQQGRQLDIPVYERKG